MSVPIIYVIFSEGPDDLYEDNFGAFFFSFSGWSILFFFLTILYIRETKDKTHEEIVHKFASRKYQTVARSSSLN